MRQLSALISSDSSRSELFIINKIMKNQNKSRREIKSLDDEYKKIAELGEGSYGIVYKCVQKKSNQEFAVKQIQKRGIRHQKGWSYINNEIQILRSLKQQHCENIVQFHEALETESHIYIVIELCDITLRKYVAQNPPDQKFVIEVIVDGLFNILTLFKKKSIIHRDIKDQNLMIKNGVLKIIDFGVSVLNTTARSCIGTPNYMAPQIGGHQSQTYGQQVDIWSVGVVLHKIVDSLPRDFRFNVKKLKLTSVKLGSTKFSEELKSFIESCLVVMPNRRQYQVFKRKYQILRGKSQAVQQSVQVKQKIQKDLKSMKLQFNQYFQLWELFIQYQKQLHNQDKKYYFYVANFFLTKFLRIRVQQIHAKFTQVVSRQVSNNMRQLISSISQAKDRFAKAVRFILKKLKMKMSSSLALQLNSSVIVNYNYFYQTMTQTAFNHFLDLYEDCKNLSNDPNFQARRTAALDYLHFYQFFLTPETKDLQMINFEDYAVDMKMLMQRDRQRGEQIIQQQIETFIKNFCQNIFKQDK